MKRLAILFFYDKRGDVDGSFTYYANELKKSVSKLYIIANEPLTPEGREKLMEITDYVKVRENKGFDVWAYKEAMEDLSGEMNEYDEVILTNSTMFGPLYSLDEMFAKMDAKTLDFWGLTVFHKVNFDPFGTCFYGYITLHLQSHFIVVRKSLFSSPEFKNYWDTMPQINSYQDSVGKHETKFTKWFEDKGFKWEAYIDTKDLDEGGIYINPIINSALELVKNRRCPFVKKRMFWHNLTDTISHHTNGEVARQTFDFIKENTN